MYDYFNETAPAHIDPDYYHESRQPVIAGVCGFLMSMTVVAIVLRFYSRHLSGNGFWWDDWLALAGVPFCLIAPTIDLVQLRYGYGRHSIVVMNTDPNLLVTYGINLYIIIIFYGICLALFKLSILALYWRIFPVVRWIKPVSITLAVITCVWVIVMQVLHMFRCTPIESQWHFDEPSTCIMDSNGGYYIQSIPTIFLDFAIMLIPIPLLLQLQLPLRTRVGIICVFLLSGIVLIISIFRLYTGLTASLEDALFTHVDVGLWSVAEPITGLISACFLTYGPLIRLGRQKLGLSTAHPSNSTGYNRANRYGGGSGGMAYGSRSQHDTRLGTSQSHFDSSKKYPGYMDSDTLELTARELSTEKSEIQSPPAVYVTQGQSFLLKDDGRDWK